jgi:hypothetical protein
VNGDTCEDTILAGSVDEVEVTSVAVEVLAAAAAAAAAEEVAISSGLTALGADGVPTGAEWLAIFGGAQHSSAPA